MVGTILEGATKVLETIWERNGRLWPEWLWDVSPATIEIIPKYKYEEKKKQNKPIAIGGRKRIIVWTSRELTTSEKELIPSTFEGWRVSIEVGSQFAYERYLKRIEAEQEVAKENDPEPVSNPTD